MKKHILLPAILGLFFLSTLAWAAAPPTRLGALVYASGQVSWRAGDAGAWSPAMFNQPLTTGNELLTGNGTNAEIQIGSSYVRMDSGTELSVLTIDNASAQLRLLSGSVDVELHGQTAGRLFQVTTPDASASLLLPGSYRLDAQADGSSQVIVRQGDAEVTSGSSAVAVYVQQAVVVPATGFSGLTVEAAPQLDAWDQWNVSRDQLESRLASNGYVSPTAVGWIDLFEYGQWVSSVWIPPVPFGWHPFQYGHYARIGPWGRTWVSNEPWGFVTTHYGYWEYIGQPWGWAWVPGPFTTIPVFLSSGQAFGPDGNHIDGFVPDPPPVVIVAPAEPRAYHPAPPTVIVSPPQEPRAYHPAPPTVIVTPPQEPRDHHSAPPTVIVTPPREPTHRASPPPPPRANPPAPHGLPPWWWLKHRHGG
jgi:hypothetical protein